MKKTLWILLLLLTGISSYAFDFVQNGKALCEIAVPVEMSDLEIMAKNDLAAVLKKITGADFKVVREDQVKSPAIYVGNTRYAIDRGFGKDKFQDEEWLIRTDGKNLILNGGGLAGSFFSVQALLRKAGYYMLTFDQEIYPRQATLSLKNIDERKKPAFAGRCLYDSFPENAYNAGISFELASAYNMFLLRNLQNCPGQNACKLRPFYIGKSFNILQYPHYHSLLSFVHPDKYFKTHPEYYAMDKAGKRVKPRTIGIGTSLCMSNPRVVEIAKQSMVDMIRKNRETLPEEYLPQVYDISLLDDFGYICYCPECTKVINRHGGPQNGGTNSLLMLFSNAVAEAAAKEQPGAIVRIFNYNHDIPSKTVKPVPNILIWYSDHFTRGDTYRPLTSKFNRYALQRFMNWKNSGAKLMIWDYWNLPGTEKRPETVIDSIQPDFQLFHKSNVTSLFIEAGRQLYCPQTFSDLHYFVGAQLMIDPYQDVEKLIGLFVRGYYGPAADVMREYLEALRKGVKEHPTLQISVSIARWKFFTSDFVVNWYKKLTAAEKSLPENSPYRARVRADKLTLLWAVCVARESFYQPFAKAGISMDDLEKECYSAAKKYLTRLGPHRDKNYARNLDADWEVVSAKIPIPPIFKDIPIERLRLVGYPFFRQVRSHDTSIVKDPEATCGTALKSAHRMLAHHGILKQFGARNEYCSTAFFLDNLNLGGRVELKLDKVPQDEKYHWYRIPGTFDLKSRACFWGHGWGIQMRVSHVYVLTDGVANNNLWQGWFRAKFTGPAYVKGSKQRNAIWIDLVALTRPGEASLAKYPASGLVK